MRDPVHGLIVFSGNDPFEQLAWRLINAREFQRLRRIKQLGFSEFVYPGATHTRFSHSVGVFHTARSLVKVLKKKLGGEFCAKRAEVAICAALLHDVGHGPFSHTFEGVMKKIGRKKSHEDWTYDIITANTQISRIIQDERGEIFRNDVGDLIKQEHPVDIYSSIISSQFDADRLDYLRRDKLMTGTEHGGFDWEWLLNNLEIRKLPFVVQDDQLDNDDVDDEMEGLILNSKGLCAAEEYLVARYHLCSQVYLHKTTRAAEKMLECLLEAIADRLSKGASAGDFNLPKNHALVNFFSRKGGSVDDYIALDDITIWGALPYLSQSDDEFIKDLSFRLLHRNLYKCLDVGAMARVAGSGSIANFKRILKSKKRKGTIQPQDVLEDEATVTAYKYHDFESSGTLSKVMILRPDKTGEYEIKDIAEISSVIKAVDEGEKVYRVYAKDVETMNCLNEIWTEARQ